TGFLAGRPLDFVDRRPAGVLDDRHATLCEQHVDRGGGRFRFRLEATCGGVLQQELDRLGRVLLVRADYARRAALDPAGAVDARLDAAALVGDRATLLVENHARQPDAVVADAAEDEPTRQRLVLVRRHGAVVRVELVADELDSLDPLLAEDRHGRVEEAEDDAARLAPKAARGGRIPRPRGRTRAAGSRDGRCTRRRTPWPPTIRASPRPGCRAGGLSARRPRR